MKIKREFLWGFSANICGRRYWEAGENPPLLRTAGNILEWGEGASLQSGQELEWEVLKDVAATNWGLSVLELVMGTWFKRPREGARREVRSRRGEGRQHGRGWG